MYRNYDVRCPYCSEDLKINHDDGYGYEQDELHQQECSKCLKLFTYTTSLIFFYNAEKADCLNEGEHQYEKTRTIPDEAARLRCSTCGDEQPIIKHNEINKNS